MCLIIFTSLIILIYLYTDCKENVENGFMLNFPLTNILKIEWKVKSSYQRIFFLETHMEKERDLSDPRQACSVESAALMNPDSDVYFIFATDSDGINMKSSELIFRLAQYPNIHFVFVNPIEISRGTSVESFFSDGTLENSSYPIEHMADVLRILILNKFGGQYIDLDVFSLVPLSVINKKNLHVHKVKIILQMES